MTDRADFVTGPRRFTHPRRVEPNLEWRRVCGFPRRKGEPHVRHRPPAGAGPAAPRRQHPRRRGRRSPATRPRPCRRPTSWPSSGQLPALRLRPPEESAQRPPDLLQGPRLAAGLRDVQGGRRDHGRGDDDLPRVRSRLQGHPTPIIPWVDVATGSLGQGLPIGVGVALAGKRLDRLPYSVWVVCGDSEMAEGSIWEAFDQAAFYKLDNLVAIVDMNRLGQTGETMHGWDRDVYAAAPRRSAGTRSRSTATTSTRSTPPTRKRSASTGKPTAILARTEKGKGVVRGREPPGKHGKALDDQAAAIEELGGERFSWSRFRSRTARTSRTDSRDGDARAAALRARRQGGDPQGVRRRAEGARGHRPDGGRARRRGLQLDPLGGVPQGAPGALLRDVHRRAADGRGCGGPAGAGLEAVRLHVRRVLLPRLRLHPHGGDLPARPCALRVARRRLDRRGRSVADGAGGSRDDARPSGARTVLYPCDANQTAKLVAAMADLNGISYVRTTRAATPVIYGPDEDFPVGGARCVRLVRGRRRHDRRRRDHAPRGADRRRPARRGRHLGPRRRRLLGQADRRGDAPRGRRGDARAASSSSRTTGPRAASAKLCSPRSRTRPSARA